MSGQWGQQALVLLEAAEDEIGIRSIDSTRVEELLKLHSHPLKLMSPETIKHLLA